MNAEAFLNRAGSSWDNAPLSPREQSLARMRGEYSGTSKEHWLRSDSESAMEQRVHRAARKAGRPKSVEHEYMNQGRDCAFCHKQYRDPVHVRPEKTVSPEVEARVKKLMKSLGVS